MNKLVCHLSEICPSMATNSGKHILVAPSTSTPNYGNSSNSIDRFSIRNMASRDGRSVKLRPRLANSTTTTSNTASGNFFAKLICWNLACGQVKPTIWMKPTLFTLPSEVGLTTPGQQKRIGEINVSPISMLFDLALLTNSFFVVFNTHAGLI